MILSGIPYLGSIKARLLIKHFGSARHVLETKSDDLQEIPGIGKKLVENLTAWKKNSLSQQNFELADKHNIKIISYLDPFYPKRLLEIYDHPLIIYVKGQLKPGDQQSLAIVGTRQSSIYGNESAEKIARELAQQRFTIVSGLARGIDTAAHQGALAEGRTIAVIGSGLLDIYPRENISLARKIEENGAVISEFSPLTPPDRQNFPQRNRIVSGMTLGTLLIEAPLKSGAMLTMEKAVQQERKLFALPGRVDDKNFEGNHSLIKNGEAQLIENAEDILQQFHFLPGFSSKKSFSSSISLEPEEVDFLSLLPSKEVCLDEMVMITKYPIKKLNVLVMSLVLKKKLKEFPGRIFKKIF